VTQWDEITSFPNLCRAARRAARGKRRQAGVARFLERLEPEALALRRELLEGVWRPSLPTTFAIHDPKTRTITAAPFRDRVVHHALVDPLEALFEAALVPQTFACRRGKGTHRAIEHARSLVRTHGWFLKLDVRHCFESIGHSLVLETLAGLRLEEPVTDLCARLLAGPEERLGAGLPIGNLTSQWFANLVLGRLDRFVMAEIRPAGYARYMDDFVLFSDGKGCLREAQVRIGSWLRAELGLALKEEATSLAPAREGLPFLGWRLHRGVTRLRPRNLRRLRGRIARRRWELREGRIGPSALAACLRSLAAHLAHGDTLGLRRMLFAPLEEVELGSGSPAPRTA